MGRLIAKLESNPDVFDRAELMTDVMENETGEATAWWDRPASFNAAPSLRLPPRSPHKHSEVANQCLSLRSRIRVSS